MSNNIEQIKQRILLMVKLYDHIWQLAKAQFDYEFEQGTQKSSRLNLIGEMATKADKTKQTLQDIMSNIELLSEIDSDVEPMKEVTFVGSIISEPEERAI